MAISATDTAEVTVNAANVRYSLNLFKFGLTTGSILLQRSQKNLDGTWTDDPRPGSSLTVEIPESVVPAVDAVLALLPTILGKLGVTDTYDKYMMKITGTLTNGVLDVSIWVRDAFVAAKSVTVPSLTAFLTQHQDVAMSILGAWDALDTAINAANATERWL